ncbi:hypothetical protein M3629_17505 [Paenibacillus polysaccharolyticus]|uniref:hypothetical protein n=1 Tax=Paenibacillus polysaccharolyticus TaxID=582692 RepID=UPI00203B7659|nr:hypothetical protein [Paenibacillus polysaccharolyticus]MCM3134589.1 hypothetical protein [Paenibacillus polysaccharolyticus]
MTLHYISKIDGKAVLYSDTRVSVTYNNENYWCEDGFEKAYQLGDKLIAVGGYWKHVKAVINSINKQHSVKDIQKIVKHIYQGNKEELSVFVVSHEQDDYYLHQMASVEDFMIHRDKLEEGEAFAAGAHCDKALAKTGSLIKWGNNLNDSIIGAYKFVTDEMVGGTVTRFTMEKNKITKEIIPIPDKVELKIWKHQKPKFHANMQGEARMKKLTVTDTNNTLLMDSATKKFMANQWDMVGLGAIDAELLAANMLTAQDGVISNLTAGKLSTLTNAALEGWSDYVRIEGNSVMWITGRVKPGSGVQKTLPDGRSLYWTTAEQMGLMTIEETGWPVMVYDMEEKIKRIDTFEGSGDAAQPVRRVGAGDGGANGSATFTETKYNGGISGVYKSSNTGKERSVDFKDSGVYLDSQDAKMVFTAKELTAMADGGPMKIGNTNGYIEITADGTFEFHGKAFNFHTN